MVNKQQINTSSLPRHLVVTTVTVNYPNRRDVKEGATCVNYD